MQLTAEDVRELLSVPIYRIRRVISPSAKKIQQEFSNLIIHAADRARSLDKSARARRQPPDQVEDLVQARFASAMRTLFRNLGGDSIANGKAAVPIDQFASSILQMGFTWATYSLDEAWVLSTKMDADLDSRISWEDFSSYVNTILESTERLNDDDDHDDGWGSADGYSRANLNDESPVVAVLRVAADQARAEGISVLTRLDQLAIQESNGSTLGKVAAKKLLEFLAVDVAPDAWEDVQQLRASNATLQATGDLDECLRELSWTRVLIHGQLAAFDDKFEAAKRQVQEFEERRRHVDDIKDSRVNDSIALSAVEAFFERDSPGRSPKHRAQSPTKLRRTKSSPDLRLRRPPSTPHGFGQTAVSPVSRRSSLGKDDISYVSEHFTLNSKASSVIRTPLNRRSVTKNVFDEESSRWRSTRKAGQRSSLSDAQDLALGTRVIQMLYN